MATRRDQHTAKASLANIQERDGMRVLREHEAFDAMCDRLAQATERGFGEDIRHGVTIPCSSQVLIRSLELR